MTAPMELRGQLTISRHTHNREGDRIVVTLTDTVSRATIAEAEVALADFAQAITGLANVDCPITVWPERLAKLGTVRENQTRHLILDHADVSKRLRPHLHDSDTGTELWRQIVEEAWHATYPQDEGDGWRPFAIDKRPNPHRWARQGDGTSRYAISVERYVVAPDD